MVRTADLRCAGGGRFEIEIVADALQARLVDEHGELDLPDDGRRRGAGNRGGDLTLRVDRDRRGVLRDRQAGIEYVALRRDDAALRVQFERTVARVGGAAVRQRDLEEA